MIDIITKEKGYSKGSLPMKTALKLVVKTWNHNNFSMEASTEKKVLRSSAPPEEKTAPPSKAVELFWLHFFLSEQLHRPW